MRSTFVLITTLLSLLSQSHGLAQVVLPEEGRTALLGESVFGLGFYGGPTSGIGLSFRHHLPSEFSYQITGGIIKVDEQLSYAVGLEGQYDFVRSSAARVFFVGGMGYYSYSGDGRNEFEAPARAGLGLGAEFEVHSGFHFIGEALFTYFSDGTILPLPQVGFFYYFR